MRLKAIHKIEGIIVCVGNTHIGGNKDSLEIQSMGSPVVKHPINGEPYIPGSSLKGKMRSTMELLAGKTDVCNCGGMDASGKKCMVCIAFGSFRNQDTGPTRLIVRDSPLTENTREEYGRFVQDQNKSYFGVKMENKVDRKTGRAMHPRTIEFVAAGAEFNMELVLQEYEGDVIDDMINFVKKALKGVEETYLGGQGSRGYGKVRFKDLSLDGNPFIIEDVQLGEV